MAMISASKYCYFMNCHVITAYITCYTTQIYCSMCFVLLTQWKIYMYMELSNKPLKKKKKNLVRNLMHQYNLS